MAIASTQQFVFRNQRAAFGEALERIDLSVNTVNESVGFCGTVGSDETPNLFDIALRGSCDSNAKFCGHA